MKKRFGFVLFDGVEELDFVGPWELAQMWSRELGGGVDCFTMADTLEPVSCAKGLKVLPDRKIQSVAAVDFLLVPGGQGTKEKEVDVEFLASLKRLHASSDFVFSVCTGSILLAAAGLSEGKMASTHWKATERLLCYGVTPSQQRVTVDGRYWSGAGVSSGMDLLLSFVAEYSGREIASKVQAAAEYYPSPLDLSSDLPREEKPSYLANLKDVNLPLKP